MSLTPQSAKIWGYAHFLRPFPAVYNYTLSQLFGYFLGLDWGGKLPILVIVLYLYCIAFQLYLHYNTSCLKSSPHFAS